MRSDVEIHLLPYRRATGTGKTRTIPATCFLATQILKKFSKVASMEKGADQKATGP